MAAVEASDTAGAAMDADEVASEEEPIDQVAAAAMNRIAEKVGQKRERAPAEEEPMMAPVPDEMSLPTAAIMRIIKSKLPDGIMINKDAKAAFAKACSIFILYLTVGCARLIATRAPVPLPHASRRARSASDNSKNARRTTLNAHDVITALKDLEFEDFVPNLEICLAGASPAQLHTPARPARPVVPLAPTPITRAQPSARPRRRSRSRRRRSGRRACRCTARPRRGPQTSTRRATWTTASPATTRRRARTSRLYGSAPADECVERSGPRVKSRFTLAPGRCALSLENEVCSKYEDRSSIRLASPSAFSVWPFYTMQTPKTQLFPTRLHAV